MSTPTPVVRRASTNFSGTGTHNSMSSPGAPRRLNPIPSPNDRNAPPAVSLPGGQHSPLTTKGRAAAAPAASQHAGLDAYHGRLRRDVLAIQSALEAAGRRAPLSFETRKVEAEVLRSTHEATAEDRMASLLAVLERKVTEVAAAAMGCTPAQVSAAFGTSTRGGSSPAPALPGHVQPRTPPPSVIGPLLEAVLSGHHLDVGGESTSRPPSSSAGDADGGKPAASTRSATPPPSAPSPTDSATVPVMVAEQALSETTRQRLAALGISAAATPSLDALVAALLTEIDARQHGSARPALEPSTLMAASSSTPPPRSIDAANASATSPARVAPGSPSASVLATVVSPAARESMAAMHQQAVMELEALRAKLVVKDRELAEMQRQLSSSRYAFNAPRTLTTVHDAPMSFEVERQYQRELHRLAGRVRELESDYEALHRAGEGDRRRVAEMTKEADALREQIAGDKRTIADLEKECERQQSLFSGVSKARSEEARMSLVAVKQLESRVADLEDKLSRKTEECKCLLSNAESVWDSWHATDTELTTTTSELAEAKDLLDAFATVYNDAMAQQLEASLREVHRLGRLGDEQTALTTIQKQRLDDAEMLRSLTVHEQQLWMERLKSSTEWKMLNVKSPDETKQLAVRIMMLTGEKEKKENTMISSHSERLKLFEQRAEREVSERCERRETAMPLVDAASLKARWHGEQESITAQHKRERQLNATSGQGGRTTRLRYTDVKEAYLAEIGKRRVEFRSFFNDEVEARAAQEMVKPSVASVAASVLGGA